MSRIADLEQKIIRDGMTDADLMEYGKLLARVRGNYARRQHCYTTAIQFPPERAAEAVRLIRYGLENFEDDWFSTYTSYLYLGRIYERTGDYAGAYEQYLSARRALNGEHAEYESTVSLHLLWMRLHIDRFAYSPEADEYDRCAETAGEFEKAMLNNEFRLSLAKIVIALHHGRDEEAICAYERAKQISGPNAVGKLQGIFQEHHHTEQLEATPESLAYLRSLRLT